MPIKKKQRLVILIFIVFLFGVIAFFVINNFGRPQVASLQVDSNPVLDVFVDGKDIGKSPITETYDAKEVAVQIGNYETGVQLESGIKTIIDRDFSSDQSESAGEVVSFQKLSSNNILLSVIANPGDAEVFVDGILKGDVPLTITGLSQGTHELKISAENFSDRSFEINMVQGYRLTAEVDLAPSTSANATVARPDKNLNEVMVEILSTPTGFLNVRSEPTILSAQVGKAYPKEEYPFIKVDAKSGWYEIQLDPLTTGWISNTYAATVSGQLRIEAQLESAVQDPYNKNNPN